MPFEIVFDAKKWSVFLYMTNTKLYALEDQQPARS